MSAPIKKFSLGQIQIAVWENDYQGNKSYSFSIQKSYKTDEGWKQTTNFKQSDLPQLAELCNFVAMKHIKEHTPQQKQELPPAVTQNNDDLPF